MYIYFYFPQTFGYLNNILLLVLSWLRYKHKFNEIVIYIYNWYHVVASTVFYK